MNAWDQEMESGVAESTAPGQAAGKPCGPPSPLVEITAADLGKTMRLAALWAVSEHFLRRGMERHGHTAAIDGTGKAPGSEGVRSGPGDHS